MGDEKVTQLKQIGLKETKSVEVEQCTVVSFSTKSSVIILASMSMFVTGYARFGCRQ